MYALCRGDQAVLPRIGVVQSDRGARLKRVHHDPRIAQTQAHDMRSLGNQAVAGLGIGSAPVEAHIVRRIRPN
jgi:hypothetical protein